MSPVYKVPHYRLTGDALHEPRLHSSSHSQGGTDEVALDGSQVTSGLVDTAVLGNGTADATTFLRGNGTFAAPGSRKGAWPAMLSGQWYDATIALDLPLVAFGMGANSLSAAPFLLFATVTYDQLAFTVTTPAAAGTLCRMGVYAATGEGQPGKLLVGSSALPIDVATTVTYTLPSSLTLGPGLYYLATLRNATASFVIHHTFAAGVGPLGATTVASTQLTSAYVRALAYGALPDPFGTAGGSPFAVRIQMRVA